MLESRRIKDNVNPLTPPCKGGGVIPGTTRKNEPILRSKASRKWGIRFLPPNQNSREGFGMVADWLDYFGNY